MMKYKYSKQLIVTAFAMAFVLVLVILAVVGLIYERNEIKQSLNLAKYNRDQLLKTENITESLFSVEMKFQEYCVTFADSILEEYKVQVGLLANAIRLLQDSSETDENQIVQIFGERTKAGDLYMHLRLLTDSLLFSSVNLEENHNELKPFVRSKVDTLSVRKTIELNKKGVLGKVKSFIIGEKVKQNIDTKLAVRSFQDQSGTGERNYGTTSGLLASKVQELRLSELKLIRINNRLIGEIRELVNVVKEEIRDAEAEQNKRFLSRLERSAISLQSTLIILMILAGLLAVYIVQLAYNNAQYQNRIVGLNEQITKDSIEKDKFFSIISHDLMNPFNALMGFSDMLRDSVKKKDMEDIEQSSIAINQSSKRIFNLLQNLLVWSRVQNGTMKYSPDLLNVDNLIEESLMVLAPMAKNKEIELHWKPGAGLSARLDRNMISSVLQNLVTNALKFTPRGGKVTVHSAVDQNVLHFVVEDTGIGMSADKLAGLFRLDKTSLQKGTEEELGSGLGLVLCKEFIEKHEGHIQVESSPGKGSCFTIQIPLNS